MANEALLTVDVVLALAPRQVRTVRLQLPAGSCVGDAVRASGLLDDLAPPVLEALSSSVWGTRAASEHPLRMHDRVELTRGLTVDPKVARRERFARQGARGTGLFARRRAGAKSGY